MAESMSRTFMVEARSLADAGQFGKAIEVLQQGLQAFPKMVSARVLLGEVYMTSGDFVSAKVELEQVIQAMPDNFAAYRRLVLVYRDLKDTQAAAKACEAVLHANPKDREMKDLLEELLAEGRKEKLQAASPVLPAAVDMEESTLALETERETTERLSMPLAVKEPVPVLETGGETAEGLSMPPAAEEPAPAMETEIEETDSETLAELYIAQGHRDKGLEVYRRLAATHPEEVRFDERISALEESGAEYPAQATHAARVRRLEGWLAVIRERRRS